MTAVSADGVAHSGSGLVNGVKHLGCLRLGSCSFTAEYSAAQSTLLSNGMSPKLYLSHSGVPNSNAHGVPSRLAASSKSFVPTWHTLPLESVPLGGMVQ
jgi:hypothetical protein